MGNGIKPMGDRSGKAHSPLEDLAYSAFVGDNDADDEGGTHDERHQYYADLVAKQKSGKALTAVERDYIKQAVAAHDAVKDKPRDFDLDDAALSVFGKSTLGPKFRNPTHDSPAAPAPLAPQSRMPAGRPGPAIRGIGNGVDYGYGPTDERGLPLQQDYDPTGDLRGTKEGLALQNLEALKKFAPGAVAGYNRSLTKPGIKVDAGGYVPDDFSPTTPQGSKVIIGRPGEPVAVDERGNEIGASGVNFGPAQDEGVRFLDRRKTDVFSDDTDALANTVRGGKSELEYLYGDHLKEVEDNEGKYPAGYFRGMDEKRKKEIKDGVYKLMLERRGTRT